MAGSKKRLTQEQRAKGRAKTAGKKKDPATGLVLAAASLVPVAGVGARAAAGVRAAAAASKAKKVKVVKDKPKVKTKERFTGERKDGGTVTNVRKTKGQRREEMLRERNSKAGKKATKEALRKKRLREAAKRAEEKRQAKRDRYKAENNPRPPKTQREADHRAEWDSLRARGLADRRPPPYRQKRELPKDWY